MEPKDKLYALKKKEIILHTIFFPFPFLAGLSIYSIKFPGNYFFIPLLANTDYAYAGAAIGIIGCAIELALLLPIFKERSELLKS